MSVVGGAEQRPRQAESEEVSCKFDGLLSGKFLEANCILCVCVCVCVFVLVCVRTRAGAHARAPVCSPASFKTVSCMCACQHGMFELVLIVCTRHDHFWDA